MANCHVCGGYVHLRTAFVDDTGIYHPECHDNIRKSDLHEI